MKIYNVQVGYKPKWILIFGIVFGVFSGGLIIYIGYQANQVLFLYGVIVMIFSVVLSVIIYLAIKRGVEEVKSDTGLDLEGVLDMDSKSINSGLAEVMNVEATGEYVNNQPKFILILKITAPDQNSFLVEHKQAFHDENLISVGAKIPVIFDKNKKIQLIGLGDSKPISGD